MNNSSTEIDPISSPFNLAELVLMNNALNEVLNGPDAIDESEFELRTGATPEEARDLLDKLGRVISIMENSPTIHSTRTR